MVLLFDRFNMPEDIYEVLFATEQQSIAARLLCDYMKENNSEIGKTEMSLFANKLDEGIVATVPTPKYRGKKIRVKYNKKQFYDRVLTPLRSMGMIDFDMYKKRYKLSKAFAKEVMQIGRLWSQEVDAPVSTEFE